MTRPLPTPSPIPVWWDAPNPPPSIPVWWRTPNPPQSWSGGTPLPPLFPNPGLVPWRYSPCPNPGLVGGSLRHCPNPGLVAHPYPPPPMPAWWSVPTPTTPIPSWWVIPTPLPQFRPSGAPPPPLVVRPTPSLQSRSGDDPPTSLFRPELLAPSASDAPDVLIPFPCDDPPLSGSPLPPFTLLPPTTQPLLLLHVWGVFFTR